MALDPATALFEMGKLAIDRLFPNKVKRAEEMRKLMELKQAGNMAELDAHVQLMVAQINVNLEQAKHKSLFVAGARPFIIWVGGFSLAWSGLIHPLLTWIWAFNGIEGTPPPLIESGVLGSVLMGLLGVAGMRSFDKKNNVETNSLS